MQRAIEVSSKCLYRTLLKYRKDIRNRQHCRHTFVRWGERKQEKHKKKSVQSGEPLADPVETKFLNIFPSSYKLVVFEFTGNIDVCVAVT